MNHIVKPKSDFYLDLQPCNRVLPVSQPDLVCKEAFSWSQEFCRNRLLGRMKQLGAGSLEFHDFELNRAGESNRTPARIYVHDPDFYRRTLLGGTIGAAESFMDGEWTTDNLVHLVGTLIQNMNDVQNLERTWSRALRLGHWLFHQLRRNTRSNSRRNIYEHYDLGNHFYKLFLDPTMNYSSGVFPSTNASMHEASLNKMRLVCNKLQLQPGQRVVEIGTGWGGLATFMAREYGVQVTTTTISKQQYALAQERVHSEGLGDRVTVLLEDYRDLKGKFDKLVSIEMIEAVGHQYFDQYFAKCGSLLNDNGTMLVQAITIGEQHYDRHVRTVDFISRYIFPGGCLPSVAAMNRSIGKGTDLRLIHLEDLSPHYELTLQHWRSRFHQSLDAVRNLGFDDRFIRMWHFYLCYCEAAFAARRVNVVQAVWGKAKSQLDPAVDYRRSFAGSEGGEFAAKPTALAVS